MLRQGAVCWRLWGLMPTKLHKIIYKGSRLVRFAAVFARHTVGITSSITPGGPFISPSRGLPGSYSAFENPASAKVGFLLFPHRSWVCPAVRVSAIRRCMVLHSIFRAAVFVLLALSASHASFASRSACSVGTIRACQHPGKAGCGFWGASIRPGRRRSRAVGSP